MVDIEYTEDLLLEELKAAIHKSAPSWVALDTVVQVTETRGVKVYLRFDIRRTNGESRPFDVNQPTEKVIPISALRVKS
jgi:hypothetical protein